MFISEGVLRYSVGDYHKLILEVDPEIARLYRKLIPAAIRPQGTRYKPHISVIRWEQIGQDKLDQFWGKYEGESVIFEYSPEIIFDETYVWINAYSARLEEIRIELGLPPFRPFYHRWHITVGNTKNG